MKFIIAFACLIATVCAFAPAVFPEAPISKYDISDNKLNSFWTDYMIRETYSVHDAAHLVIAFLDSAAGEIDDIFPDASLKLAIYQAVSLFTFPAKGAKQEHHDAITWSFSAISAWGTNEAQAAATVDVLLSLTNRVYHHYIDADQDFHALTGAGTHLTKKVNVPGDEQKLAALVIQFTLNNARKAVKNCYKPFRDEIVEGTDAIILCEAFAYSTRGFPTEPLEAKHDTEKRTFMIEIIEFIKREAQADIPQFAKESLTGIAGYRACIIAEAKALDRGFAKQINALNVKGVKVNEAAALHELEAAQLPTKQEVATYTAQPITDAKPT